MHNSNILPSQLFNENPITRSGGDNVYNRMRSTSGASKSSGNKYNKRTLSREDDHSENMMLVDQRHGIAAYANQYDQRDSSMSSEKKPNPHNNSFLARREALQ